MTLNKYSPVLLVIPSILLISCSQNKVSETSSVTESSRVSDSSESVAMLEPAPVIVVDAASSASVASLEKAADASAAADSSMALESTMAEPDKKQSSEPALQAQSGIVTAGEWNDLDNWRYWNQLIDKRDFATHLDHWQVYPKHRVSVSIQSNQKPVTNAIVQLVKQSDDQQRTKPEVVWTARTDNKGSAVLWAHFFKDTQSVKFDNYKLRVNGHEIDQNIYPHNQQVMSLNLNKAYVKPVAKKADIAFIVDATGSMQDEIDFLKRDLQSVIHSVKDSNNQINIETAAVFYRDRSSNGAQEEYLVRKDDFGNLNNTLQFIQKQNADGGGDYPEAVDVALDTAINKLDWSDNAHARIAFLLLDAPPHHEPEVLASIQQSIVQAAAKGIKIIPITASGIDKETEFLMRSLAMGTNGTYTFITDDSGVGNAHIEASVGDYEVEKLNALMIRLIKEYTDFH